MKSSPAPIVTHVLAMPRPAKRAIVLLVDASFCMLTVWIALCLRLGELVQFAGNLWWPIVISMASALPIFMVFGLYRAIFRYSGIPAMLAVTKAMTIYALIFFVMFTVMGIDGVPRTIGIVQPFLLLIAIASTRAGARFWLGGVYQNQLRLASLPAGLIFGSGTSGRQLAAELEAGQEMRIIGFLDDDERLHGQILNGLPIFSPSDLPYLVAVFHIQSVLLALPSIGRSRRNQILAILEQVPVAVRTVRGVDELSTPYTGSSNLRELDIDDLLGDFPIASNHILLRKNVAGKIVLVTGAGGFVGRELCRQIIKLEPEILLMVDQSEFLLDRVHKNLQSMRPMVKVLPLLASVRDEERMQEVISTWKPATIYHAAASKHVDLIEHNSSEGIKNNVLGTLVPAMAALDYGVTDFILISTSQAIHPKNSMGASKRLAELIVQGLSSAQSNTRFSAVRLGDIFDTSGPEIAAMRQQIKSGVTSIIVPSDVTKSFMTVSEAVQLIIQAGALGKGGEIFSLDTGRHVDWARLAKKVVAFSGRRLKDLSNPNGDLEISASPTITGLSSAPPLPCLKTTLHCCIFKNEEEFVPWPTLREKLASFELVLNVNDVALVRHMLSGMIVDYVPDGEIVDWVHVEASGVRAFDQ